jgi:hypothetical protein
MTVPKKGMVTVGTVYSGFGHVFNYTTTLTFLSIAVAPNRGAISYRWAFRSVNAALVVNQLVGNCGWI